MLEFEQCFDASRQNTPYDREEQNLTDWLTWLDMLLESLFALRGGLQEGAVYYKRGTVATHEEIAQLLRQPDRRQTRQPGPDAQALQQGFAHILSRQNATHAQGGTILPLSVICTVFDLNAFEFLCLLLAVAPEYDRRYQRIFGYLQDTLLATTPTVGLARDLFVLHGQLEDDTLYGMSGAGLKLCFEDIQEPATGFLSTRLVLNRRVLGFLFGQDTPCPATLPVLCPQHEGEIPPLLIHEQLLEQLCASLLTPSGELPEGRCRLLHLWGEKGTGKKLLASHLAAAAGRWLLSVDGSRLCATPEPEFSTLLRQLAVEGSLRGKLLLLEAPDSTDPVLCKRYHKAVTFFAAQMQLLVLTATKKLAVPELGEYDALTLHLPTPSVAQQRLLWEGYARHYRLADEISLAEYAGAYNLVPGAIDTILREADRSRAFAGRAQIAKSDLVAAISEMDLQRFDELASKVQLFYSWEDIALLPEQQSVMQLACHRLKLRYQVDESWGFKHKIGYGKGICVLFYGPPGTGKTMAAQVMARDIGMDLYRVDLSQLASKYIGDTEKNISKIFDEARRSNIILFFDEADSIFSKRTEVKSSNDKHANNEVSFLLQKIEEYSGLVILSTNLFTNFDTAFLRRVTYLVKFEQPNAAMRYQLWTEILPPQAEVEQELDLRFLADTFELTGSNIKSILYNAAFIAASQQSRISMTHLIQALKYEYAKLGKMLTALDLGRYSVYLN